MMNDEASVSGEFGFKVGYFSSFSSPESSEGCFSVEFDSVGRESVVLLLLGVMMR